MREDDWEESTTRIDSLLWAKNGTALASLISMGPGDIDMIEG